jgi:type II secretory pathway component PulK
MRRRGGSALILVLWAIFVLSICVLAAARLVERSLGSQRFADHRFEARQMALTGIAYGRDPRIEKTDPLLTQALSPHLQVKVEIASEGGRLNINKLLLREDYKTLCALFEYWGMNDEDAAVVVDCLRDWVDPGDLRSLHGAEKADLEGTEFSLPQNRPFFTVSEMRGVKGMKTLEMVKPDWEESFSVLSGDLMDVQEAGKDLLVTFGKLTEQQAELLINHRNGQDLTEDTEDDIEIKSLDHVASVCGLSPAQMQVFQAYFQVGGSPIRITSVGTAGKTKYTIEAVIAAREKSAPLLWWEEK